jgi:glycerol-3-phosphate dehydrogenase
MDCMLDGRGSMADLGTELAPGLFATEVDYLVKYEWARCAEDVLWRRTKLGLHVPDGCGHDLDEWMAARQPAPAQMLSDRACVERVGGESAHPT